MKFSVSESGQIRDQPKNMSKKTLNLEVRKEYALTTTHHKTRNIEEF